jgi:hypothetical protein
MKLKKKVDVASDVVDDIDTVKLNTLKNKNIREVGAESLCYQAPTPAWNRLLPQNQRMGR